MKLRKNTEDYLKVIYILGRSGGEIHGVRIAEVLGVSRPTVSLSLKELEKEGYLTMDHDRAVHLTARGRAVAMATYERHETLRHLLEEFGVEKEIAAADACKMEHSVSPESYEALKGLAARMRREKGI